MSFSRAPVKRFNDEIGCAPAPGTYDVKTGGAKAGAVSFQKAERFKPVKPDAAAALQSPRMDVPASPIRRTMSVDGLSEAASAKKEKAGMSIHMKQQKLLEKEIRSLVQQKGEQDRQLHALEEEVKKLEAKLLVATREKTGLAANVASLERQQGELKKTNEFLKNKFSADTSKKKINALSMELMEARNKLDAKDKELSFLQISLEGKVKILEADLSASRATLAALKERNDDLEDLHKETKSHNKELETEMDKLHGVIQELREEIKVLQEYLDTANEDILDLRSKLKASQKALEQLEQQKENGSDELQSSQHAVRQQEQELARLRVVLRRTEEELDQRVAHLGERCLVLEDERARTQEEGLRRVQELKTEIGTLEESRRAEQRELEELKESHSTLATQLGEEQERSRSLKATLEREWDLAAAERRRLEAELEEALDELSTLEAQELRGEEQLHSLQGCNQALQSELDRASEQLHRLSQSEVDRSGAEERLSQLEAQRSGAEERVRALEQEVARLSQALQEEQQRQGCLQQTQEKAREEYARMLLEARTQLAEKEEELECAQDAHGRALSGLQGELEQQQSALAELQKEREERSKALEQLEEERKGILEELEKERKEKRSSIEQLEEERGKVLEQLQEERNSALELLEKERGERSSTLISLEKEREERKAALEQLQKERDDQRRRDSAEGRLGKASRLEAMVESLEEGCAEFQKRLEESEEDRRVLEEQMEKLQQERQEMETRLTQALQQSSNDAEMEKWRSLYEELSAKVQPFQEQLDNFAAERSALLSEKGATQEELTRLADAYARLMGHQNQKQKIKHVVKLKEENFDLKEEVSKLRSQVSKQKRELEQLRPSQAPRFDPSKAFKHDHKENQRPPTTTTLKAGKRPSAAAHSTRPKQMATNSQPKHLKATDL
ncbi:hyaluronan mediated motility receptor isoform X2 [Alosa alosa]|uniref:hyaluronan mediated motility receptor isoform X2 n=1 Tax=Alosa alosa TaxID=278164 RepID=UPI0020150959|nr:hyaluronan mediated motility receptor isoform X2 [Alosa alosa]